MNPVAWRKPPFGSTNAPVARGNGGRVGAVTDGEGQRVFGDELECRRLVVHGERDDPSLDLREIGLRPLKKGAQLGVAVGAPRAAVEQDDAVLTGETVRQDEVVTSGEGHGEGRERVAGLEQGTSVSPVGVLD